jgi:hypothetical protein
MCWVATNKQTNYTRIQVATASGLPPPIDVFNGMGGVNLTHHDWFWGNGSYGCHPNMQGYAGLSTIVYKALDLQ